MDGARGIQQSQEFTEQVEVLCADLTTDRDLFYELLLDEVVSIAVALNPDRYPEIDNTGVHVVKTYPTEIIPRLRIAYKYDDEQVYLLWIDVDPDQDTM